MSDFPANVLRQAAVLEDSRYPHVLVTVAAIRGSAPQDLSAKMLVTPEGRVAGTVGGGKLEAAALRYAADLLARTDATAELVEWDLKRDIGMTCGGIVTLLFESRCPRPWTVAVYGAGHVVHHLVRVLLPLPVRLDVRDSRAEWINALPTAPNLTADVCEDPVATIGGLPPDAFVLFITQGHTTDRPILEAALRRGGFPFVGVIGSRAKAATLRRELREAGLSDELTATIRCPLGLDFGTNHPQEIAISIAAQLLLERDRLSKTPS